MQVQTSVEYIHSVVQSAWHLAIHGQTGQYPLPRWSLVRRWMKSCKWTNLNFLLPIFKLNSRALPKLEAVQLSLLSVLQLPQHVQVLARTNRESLKCCQECWSRRLCPDLKFVYSHESSCSQEIFSLLCRSKRQWRNTQSLVYLHKTQFTSCCRQDPCVFDIPNQNYGWSWLKRELLCLLDIVSSISVPKHYSE